MIAARVALVTEALIAPPVLIFLVLHHWMPLSILVLVTCGAEFVWKRTALTTLTLITATIVAGFGEWMPPGRGSPHVPQHMAHRGE